MIGPEWAEFHRIVGDRWLRDSGLTRDRESLVAYVERQLSDMHDDEVPHVGQHLGVAAEWNDTTSDMVRKRAREMPLDELVTGLYKLESCEW